MRRTSQVELPLGLEAYRNTALFSDHFLAERLAEMAWYRRDGRVGRAREAYDRLRALFEELRPEETLAQANEAQCEEDLIRPVLRALGHQYLVQAGADGGRGVKNFPDYALFRNEEEREAARREVANHDYSRAIALAEGKYWDRDLDRKQEDSRDYLTNANPSFQIINYLTRTGKRWGILTNGRLWRLYCRDAPQPLDRYFEVDLPRLVRESGAEAFLHYFWGLFSLEALTPGAGGEAHVDLVGAGSSDFAADVGDELRVRVFDALVRLAAGFVKGRDEPIGEGTLEEIYDNSLIVLYRLLFILYAEARELLPLEGSVSYREQLSLTEVVRDVADKRERRVAFSFESNAMWDRLAALWRAIDEGDDDLAVAAYDGELFDGGAHPFLTENKLADAYLADALELVGRVTRQGAPQFVDYRSLSVTHLGTVYEGLLEHRLTIDEDRLGAAEDRIVLVPAGERRRETGSYYTPDPIVRFIVREVLSPLIEGKSEGELLRLRIVDPAMGSGHFLVAAVEFLALAIVTLPERDEPADIDEDLATIKRRVVEHCIWGVDINPLAVELSKLSLWLATASTDKPLTFLDHRLRCGNSVMSLRHDDVRRHLRESGDADQATLYDESFRRRRELDLEIAAELEGADPDTMEGVERRRQLFEQQDAARERLRTLSDAAVGHIFGTVTADDLGQIATAITAGTSAWNDAVSPFEQGGLPPRIDYQPFHWELEFPEVFDQGGFDAVLGNPPYVSAWEMTRADEDLRHGLADLPPWHEVALRHWDLFVLFVALGQQLLVAGGIFGIIVANPIMRERYAEALRVSLLGGTFLKVVDFGDENVFDRVSRETVVLVWRATTAEPGHLIEQVEPESIFTV
ncbi:MAG: Eco57I restriction-modification methylase domain-containing protein [Solirubrobacterales bacterium]